MLVMAAVCTSMHWCCPTCQSRSASVKHLEQVLRMDSFDHPCLISGCIVQGSLNGHKAVERQKSAMKAVPTSDPVAVYCISALGWT